MHNRPYSIVRFIFPFQTMWCFSGELFLWNFALCTCVCTHNL